MDLQPDNIDAKQEKHLFHLYGKLPARGDLLHNQVKTRRYFDSGDFALSGANKATDVGVIQTGREHPLHQSISHPSSPVPNNCNVEEDANRQLQGAKNMNLVKDASPLHQLTNVDEKKADRTVEDGLKELNISKKVVLAGTKTT